METKVKILPYEGHMDALQLDVQQPDLYNEVQKHTNKQEVSFTKIIYAKTLIWWENLCESKKTFGATHVNVRQVQNCYQIKVLS